MGLFSRLGVMIRGFFGVFVGGLEDKNPDALYEDIKNQIDKARKEAEQQIIEIQTSAELVKIEMKGASKNLSAIKARVEAAERQGDVEVLTELLVQEEEFRETYDMYKTTYDSTMAEVAKVREDYRIFESEMNVRLNELRSLKSQAKMSYIKESINSMNTRYSTRNNRMGKVNDSMDRMREVVNKKTARANALESLNDDNMDMKLRKLDMSAVRARARARAEAMLSGDKGFEVRERIENKTAN